MTGCVAVFDVGKTNIKLVVFDPDGRVVVDRSHPNASIAPDADFPYLRLDTDRAWRFLLAALKEVGAEHPIEAISITTHGASGVLVTDTGVALPPMDYESTVSTPSMRITTPSGRRSRRCFSTLSARGLNLGRQIFYLERTFPKRIRLRARLPRRPQFWSWRLSGVMATEVTSLGAHTDLWRPKEGRLSSLVESQGWTRLFPPIRRAWETLGRLRPEIAAETGLSPEVRVICGAHIRTLRSFPISLAHRPVHRALDRHLGDHPGGRWQGADRRAGRHAGQCRRARSPRADGAPHARAGIRRAGRGNASRGA